MTGTVGPSSAATARRSARSTLYLDRRERPAGMGARAHGPVRHPQETFVPLRGAPARRTRTCALPIEEGPGQGRPARRARRAAQATHEEAAVVRALRRAVHRTRARPPRPARPDGGVDDDRRFERTGEGRETVGHDRQLRREHRRRDDALGGGDARRDRSASRHGRARLRKYVVTEEVKADGSRTSARRSASSASRSPMPTSADATDGPAISDEEHEVVLHEERPTSSRRRRSCRRSASGWTPTARDR